MTLPIQLIMVVVTNRPQQTKVNLVGGSRRPDARSPVKTRRRSPIHGGPDCEQKHWPPSISGPSLNPRQDIVSTTDSIYRDRSGNVECCVVTTTTGEDRSPPHITVQYRLLTLQRLQLRISWLDIISASGPSVPAPYLSQITYGVDETR